MPEEEKIILTSDDGETLAVYALEETRIGGTDYILAADSKEGDGTCYLLKDLSGPEEEEAVYEMVQDDREIEYLLGIFEQLLDDVEIQ